MTILRQDHNMTAQTSDFSGLLFYNPAGPGFDAVARATIHCPDSMDEGDTITVDVVTWGIPDGTTLFHIFTLHGSNLTANRFSVSSSGFTVLQNRASFTVTVNPDHATSLDGQSFDIIIGIAFTTAPLATKTVTVNDTSQTPTYALATAGSVTSVDEGVALTFNITTTNVADGTTLWWSSYNNFDGTSRMDYPTGSTTITSNAGSFSITVSADNTTAGAQQYYNVTLWAGGSPGPGSTQVASVDNIVVNDTSTTPTGLSVNWYGTNTSITPTGSYTSPQAGAVTLPSGSYVNVGQNLQSTTFTVTVDANLNSAGSPWVVLWGNDSYTAQTGYVMYWNSTTNGSLGIFQSRFVNSTTPNITTAGRQVYTSVVNGLNVAFYINGTLINSGTLTGSATTIPNNNFLIGARHSNSGTLLPDNNLDDKGGTYYSAKVQGTALTAAQVQAEWLVMPGAKTYAARQWLGSYSYGGNSGFYVLQSDYPNANLVPAGATVTVNGNAVATDAAFTSDTYSGQPVWYVFFTGSPVVVTSGTTLTFTWTV